MNGSLIIKTQMSPVSTVITLKYTSRYLLVVQPMSIQKSARKENLTAKMAVQHSTMKASTTAMLLVRLCKSSIETLTSGCNWIASLIYIERLKEKNNPVAAVRLMKPKTKSPSSSESFRRMRILVARRPRIATAEVV